MSISLLVSLLVMGASQLCKLVVTSVRGGRLNLGALVSTGGMPSAHSAFVTTLAVSVALWRGVSSELFALCGVFASITIYDSIRLRGMVDIHTRILRDLQGKVGGSAAIPIPRWVGHTGAETAVGLLVGSAAATAAYFLLRGTYPLGVLG